MWPDHFDEWWRFVGPIVFERTQGRLLRFPLLTLRGAALPRVNDLALLAAQAVYDRATERQVFAGLFGNPREFRAWAVPCGYFEALRLVLRQIIVRPWVEQLPADDRLVLVCAYADQLNDRQLGQVLGVSPQEARVCASRAYRAFCDLLRANGHGMDDDHATFPLPPILIGLQ